MDLRFYYTQIINELKASAQEAQKQVLAERELQKKRLEEAKLSSSGTEGDKSKPACDKDCKYTKLRSMFSAEILSKLLEYNLDPNSFSPKEAMKTLLTLGMPIEYALLDLEKNGTDIEGVKSLLTKNGLGNQLNRAIAVGLDNRSTSSAIAFAEGLVERQKGSDPKNLNLISKLPLHDRVFLRQFLVIRNKTSILLQDVAFRPGRGGTIDGRLHKIQSG